MATLDTLDPRFSTILCDVWGVVHDGAVLLPGVAARFARWRDEGRRVILLTNAPRPAERVEATLVEFGLDPTLWQGVASSGAAGIAALTEPSRRVGFLGTDEDRADLEAHGVLFSDEAFTELAAAGLEQWDDDVDDYRDRLARWAADGVLFHCLNPDRVVVHCGERYVCPGALADAYEALGGRVAWYGKPHPAIYDHALRLAGAPDRDTVVAIGDGLQTDMVGAARAGIAAVFVRDGIHAGEPFPADFAERHGLGRWAPLLSVDGIG